jgi:hypothetical protein
MDTEQQRAGRRLLSAVERLLDDPENIMEIVERKRRAAERRGLGGEEQRTWLGEQLVEHYSDRTGLSGGVSALPGILPGLGTIAAATGVALADMGLLLKFEVEMALALAYAWGHDISQERERRLALLLAAVRTHDARTEGNFLLDVAEAEGEAVWNYAPRQVAKLLGIVGAHLALKQAGKTALRALPIVGVVIGVGLNKSLTGRVGRRIIEDLEQRGVPDAQPEDVIDARIVETP